MDKMTPPRVLFLYPNEYMVGVAPSNLAILSACLKRAGFQTKLFDCSLYQLDEETQDERRSNLGQVKKTNIDEVVSPKTSDINDDFVRMVEEYKPDVIAVTLIDSTISFAFSLLGRIRSIGIPIVAGGVGATFLYEKILKSGVVDFVCVGEGEGAIVELCEKLCGGEDCSMVGNICLMGKDGRIIKNNMRPLVELNENPLPDFSIYDDSRFYRPFMGRVVRTLQIDLDRGCPHNCTYCAAPALRENYKKSDGSCYYRVKNLDKFFEETVALIKKYSLDFLWISSETLLAINVEKFREFAQRYKKEIGLPFWSTTRLDTFTEEKTRLLREMGCQSISVGLEHGCERIRKEILNKHIPNERILESFRILSKHDIFPTINSIIGFPGETREDIFETIELNRKITSILSGKHNVNSFIFVPFSGTELRRRSIEEGYLKEDDETPFSFTKKSVLTMPNMSQEEILGLEKTIPLYIQLPESYFPDIQVAEKDDEEGREMFRRLVGVLNSLKSL